MSRTIISRQPTGAPLRAGGQFRGRVGRESIVTLDAWSDEQLLDAAGDEKTDAKVLSKLSFSKAASVRVLVAGNPGTPVKDLERMMNRGADVRHAALQNLSLPKAVVDAVRANPRGNDALSLAERDRPIVAEPLPVAVRAQRAELPGTAADQLAAAQNPKATGPELRALSYSRNAFARYAVAAHLNTPPQILSGFLVRGRFIRGIVLRNPSLPLIAVHSVLIDASSDDLSNLALNPEQDPDVLDACALGGGTAPYRAAAHAKTSAQTLDFMSRSVNQQILRAVAENTCAPGSTRARAAANYAAIRASYADEAAAVATSA
jgi:hypothetical protein